MLPPAPRDVRDLLSNGETNYVLEGSGNSIFKLEYLQNENSDLDAVKRKMFYAMRTIRILIIIFDQTSPLIHKIKNTQN